MKWMSRMLDQGLTPNAVGFSAMIDACAKASDLAGAELWHTRMIEADIEASNHSFGPMISACAKAGGVDKDEALLDQMARPGRRVNKGRGRWVSWSRCGRVRCSRA